MIQRPIELSVTQTANDNSIRRSVLLENISDQKHSTVTVFFDLIGQTSLPRIDLLDGFVYAVLLYAMRLGQDIHVRGNISRDFIRNANEYQNAWVCWKPRVYKKIKISADSIVEHVVNNGTAIAAFSGGVDSLFTALRHGTKSLGDASYPLEKALLLVHGFDVPLCAPEQLEALKDRTAPFRQELGLELRIIRTNLKELQLQDWADSFGAQLAACLHNYSHEFAFGLIGSSEPYNALVTPWGSHPATDHLLSGGAFKVVHDGAGFSRTQKVEEIAKSSTATKVAKVCWEGKETHRNCGQCEKCIRTLLNFKAVGVDNPSCFDAPLQLEQIKGMNLNFNVQCDELRSIVTYAKSKNIQADWLDAVIARIHTFDHPPIYQRNNTLRKAIKALGMVRRGELGAIANKLRRSFGALKD